MRTLVLATTLIAGCEEVPPCDELGESECQAEHECMWSTVTRVRMNEGACEVVRESAGCYDRQMVSAGCGGFSCEEGGRPAPWYRSEADTALVAQVECGSGVVGWSACTQFDDGTVDPPICACACQ